MHNVKEFPAMSTRAMLLIHQQVCNSVRTLSDALTRPMQNVLCTMQNDCTVFCCLVLRAPGFNASDVTKLWYAGSGTYRPRQPRNIREQQLENTPQLHVVLVSGVLGITSRHCFSQGKVLIFHSSGRVQGSEKGGILWLCCV